MVCGAGAVIRRSRVQGLHPAASGTCILPVGIFKYVIFIANIVFLFFSGMLVN